MSRLSFFTNTPLHVEFSTLCMVFVNVVKHDISCLIYYSIIPIMTSASLFIVANNTNKTVVSVTEKGPPTTLRIPKLDGFSDVCGKGWQSKYQALHQDIINNKREAKFLVYFCDWTNSGCFGYGDRVRAVISLFYLAILTDRAFLIHWKTPKPLERFLTPKDINWTFPIPLLETRKHFWRNIYSHWREDLQGWQTKNISAVVSLVQKENFKVYFDKPVEIVTTNVYFSEGAMQKNKYLMQRAQAMEIRPLLPGSQRHAKIGCAFDVLFNAPPRLHNALQYTRKKLRENSSFVIGIHIRLGDKPFGINNTRVSVSDFPKYFLCAKKVEQNLLSLDGRKRARWFLATDSLLVKDYARKHFAEKVITEETKPEHIDIHKEGENSPSDEGMIGILHDHFMLAECDFLVLSHSSFSTTAIGAGIHDAKTYTVGEKCPLESKKHFNKR